MARRAPAPKATRKLTHQADEYARDPRDDEEEERLRDFARAVYEYIGKLPADSPYRFGRYKVFLAAFPGIDSRVFRRLVIEAHQAGYLRLARADLTPAMNSRIVQESEIRGGPGGISEWHFIDTEGKIRPQRDQASRRDPPSRPRRASDRPRSAEGNENLAYLLDREVRAIGPERPAAPISPDIRLLISPYGSYRYVALENGRPVSALQIMSTDGIRGTIANVYTTPVARRRGWARRLLEAARRRFREVKHSDDLTPAGEAWKHTVRDPSDEEAESWPLTEAERKLLERHIAAAELAEVDADSEESHDNLRESRARSREAGAHYHAAANVAAVPTVHNRADLRRHEERIEFLERAWRSFRRGRSHRNAEYVQRLIQNLKA